MKTSLLACLLLCTCPLRAETPKPLPLPLVNAGFEDGNDGWIAAAEDKAAGLSTVISAAARSGNAGLRVVQAEGGPGSWFQSLRTPVEAGKSYRLEFWARTLKISGVGVWVQFFDDERHEVKSAIPNLAVQVQQDSPDWAAYPLTVLVPAGATSMTLAVHCYSKRPTFVDFDDFSITPVTTSTAGAR